MIRYCRERGRRRRPSVITTSHVGDPSDATDSVLADYCFPRCFEIEMHGHDRLRNDIGGGSG